MSSEFYISTIADGSMKSPDHDFAIVLPARAAFLQKNSINPQDTTLVQVTYETDDFCRYNTLTDQEKGDGITRDATIQADALVVTKPGHALLLPLADCIGVVVHDPTQGVLMLSHLGRQNLEQTGGTKCIEYLINKHGVNPKNLVVWLSPAAGRNYYPLYAFDNRSLHDVATEQLLAASVSRDNITASPIDSAGDPDYFSHSRYIKGDRQTDGRHAVVAIMH